jgi:hypothetical protein
MPLYMMTYDAHRVRNYQRLYELMDLWSAERLLESVWLAELIGPAEVILDFIRAALDSDDSVAVVELEPTAEWAVFDAQSGGVGWLKRFIPFRD